jgi:hypothetical protein
MSAIVNDIVIQDLAAENLELRERATLTEAYRELARNALGRLHHQHREIEALRRRVSQLCDENRALRGHQAIAA